MTRENDSKTRSLSRPIGQQSRHPIAHRDRNRSTGFPGHHDPGFAALAAGEFESARALFKKAEASPFDNGDAEEGLRQIASRETNQIVDRLRQDSEIALENGAWQTAIDLLRELAALTPRSVAVQAQLNMAEERLALESEGQAYLDDPLSFSPMNNCSALERGSLMSAVSAH